MARVVLAMSGGVDSSTAAFLLKEAGHEVIGLFMRHGEPALQTACKLDTHGRSQALPVLDLPVHKQGCCTASDAEDARRVADKLQIPFYALDFQEEFGRIMDYFVEEYTHARTPNPCVMCNNWLKFGKLWDYAQSVGAEHIATGHYVRLLPSDSDLPRLVKGHDLAKDQSYVMWGIDREILPHVLFPVGGYEKPYIRQIAGELGLRVAEKKDSQEICFVSQGHYGDFVRKRRGELDLSGEIVTTSGEVVGQHQGIENYTVGQRKGLGVALGERRFVVRIEPATRRVVIGERHELEQTEIFCRQANWLIEPPTGPIACQVKTRYQAPLISATVEPIAENRLHVRLDTPDDQVAPGQACVCYHDDQVLGGGWIE